MNHQSDSTREDFKINCLIILVDMHVKYFIFFILIRFTLFLLILCISSIFSEQHEISVIPLHVVMMSRTLDSSWFCQQPAGYGIPCFVISGGFAAS